ncbi:MAG: ABC transporter substrate-binding protein [Dethiosulfovibrio peptidovorans]|nr:MAG: ABC transporter substrate-binding protein [Dethiosulfovibrio peptidovorans]
MVRKGTLWSLIAVLLVASWAGLGNAREFRDMAGRVHSIPERISKVFSIGPSGTVLLYTVDSNLLCGWNYTLKENEKRYIAKALWDLPVLGGWFGKSTGNPEEIARVDPEVLLSVGSLSPQRVSFADKIQAQIGIPVIMLDGDLARSPELYEAMGELTGRGDRCQKLAAFCRETLDLSKAILAEVPKEQRPTVYYAEGPEGLNSESGDSRHLQVLFLAGGRNVVPGETTSGRGMKAVTLEQILLWNPEIVLCWSSSRGGAYDVILKDLLWGRLPALRNRRFYEIPQDPFNWFDRPPSVNRIIGLRWLLGLFYPSRITTPLDQDVASFYELFYGLKLSDKDLEKLLSRAR